MSKDAFPQNLDPTRAWRDWFVKSEREWSESLAHFMKDDAVARSIGQQITASLHGEQMFSQGVAASMAKMNLPTRADIIALGERVGQLEDAVARVEAALTRMNHDGAALPPRTRKPPRTTKRSNERMD
jgi:hypothetical protein